VAANGGERLGWRGVESHSHAAIGRELEKGIVGHDLRHLGGGAHDYADRFARMGSKAPLKRRLDGGFRPAARENDVAAADLGAHGGKAELLAHRLQEVHWQLAGATDIHAAAR
jgi:hypothetical protein